MAYLILDESNNLYKIAANDTDLDSQNCSIPPYYTIEISDADFAKVKQHEVSITFSDGSATVVDDPGLTYETQQILYIYHTNLKKQLKQFTDNNDSSNSLYTPCINYYDTLNAFDYSKIIFPLNSSWEKYCEDNSISYLHPLQIP